MQVSPSGAVAAKDPTHSDQQGAESSSRQASGSGEHGQASRAASISLDSGSGKAGSQLPTPRLMHSTSRGLSLQASGVELCDALVRLQLAVSEDSERPVAIRIADRQDPVPRASAATQAVQDQPDPEHPRTGIASVPAAAKGPGSAARTAALPRPAVATHPSAGQRPPEPALGAVQGSAEVSAAGADSSVYDTRDGMQPQQGQRNTSEGPAIQHDDGSQAREAGSAAQAAHQTDAGGELPIAHLVEQEVHASLEPSGSNDSSPPAASSRATGVEPSHESSHSASRQAPTAALLDGSAQQVSSHSNAPARLPAASNGHTADTGTLSAKDQSVLSSPLVETPELSAVASERKGDHHMPTDDVPAGSTAALVHQTGEGQATSRRSTSTRGDRSVGSSEPTLKGLTIPRHSPGGSKPPSTAVSPTASGMQSGAAPDQAAARGAALSDHEARSPSALSDSSDFGGRPAHGSVRDSHPHAGHVDWNELGKRSSRLAALAGMKLPPN